MENLAQVSHGCLVTGSVCELRLGGSAVDSRNVWGIRTLLPSDPQIPSF